MTSRRINRSIGAHATDSEPPGTGLKKETKHAVYKMLSETLRAPTPSQGTDKPVVQKHSSSKKLIKSTNSEEANKRFRDFSAAALSSTITASKPESADFGDSYKHLTTSHGRTSIPSTVFGQDESNNNDQFSRLDLPMGLIPPPMKDCHLNNVLRSARRSLEALREVRESLSNLVAEDEQLSKGVKKDNPGPELIQLSRVAETITILSREAFVPAHRLNQTAVALYNAEDFLRYPSDIRTFDISVSGRIKLPEPTFNLSTIEKLRQVVDKATASYNGFDGKGPMSQDLQDIHFTLMRAFQDLYTCTLGCQEVFKVLLYTGLKEKQHLQQFLLSLPSMERSDMLTEVQDLRRLVDELVIFLEKLSWGSFVVYRLASGKSITPSPEETPLGTPKFEAFHTFAVHPLFKSGGSKPNDSEKKSSKSDKKSTENEGNGTGQKFTKTKKKDVSVTSVTPKKLKKSKVKAKKDKDASSKADLSYQQHNMHTIT